MNVGIIAEYNPFHKGHRLHIENTRALTHADNIIAIMSGSFVQRGEAAIADKFSRTRAALLNGIDMVLELPVVYATGAADIFALGAVDSLNKSGIVDMLSFGSEEGSIELFTEAAALLSNETPWFKALIRKALDEGVPFAAARLSALSTLLSRDMSFLTLPNNILALEYLTALNRLKSPIKPITVKRQGGGYGSHQMVGELSSAAAIRHSLKNNQVDIALSAIPENSRSIIYNALKTGILDINIYTSILKYILLTKSPFELAQINDVSEGLENRILSSANLNTITQMTDFIKSKRYTASKIRRAILHILLNITKEDAEKPVSYIRVLGFRADKAELVSQLTKKAKVPVITNVKNAPKGILDKEMFATDMYYLPINGERNKDLTTPMVIVK